MTARDCQSAGAQEVERRADWPKRARGDVVIEPVKRHRSRNSGDDYDGAQHTDGDIMPSADHAQRSAMQRAR